jgi:AbrB family looped-hinge helix DNA binding protein
MPIQFEMSVVKVGNSLRMTIPKEIVRAMNLEKGDKLLVGMNNGDMIVKKKV